MEAEGGELGGNPVSWGRAESTVGVRVHVPARGSGTAFYWLAAGQRYEEVVHINAVVSEKSPSELIRRTSDYWRAWVRKRSEEHTSGLQSLMRITYAVLCLKKKK